MLRLIASAKRCTRLPIAAARKRETFRFRANIVASMPNDGAKADFQLYNALNIARGDKSAYARQALENFNFFGAPHVAIVTTDEVDKP